MKSIKDNYADNQHGIISDRPSAESHHRLKQPFN